MSIVSINPPLDSTILPNLTMEMLVFPNELKYFPMSSEYFFVKPMTLLGFIALFVDIKITLLALYLFDKKHMFLVPTILTLIASLILFSINGICLYAAA